MPRTPPALRQAYFDFSVLQTRWMDNDQYGHMNNMIHYSLIDTAVTNWQLQHKVFDRSGDDIRFLVVESGCVYHAEAGYPDLVHAGVRVGHVGTSSWRYEVGLFRNDEPHAFAEGFFSQVQVDALTGKPKPLSAAYRDQLSQLIQPL